MAPKLVPGLYEKLITETLDRMLDGEFEPNFIEREELDRGDAHVLLARHVYREVERSLEGMSSDGAKQVELANRVLRVVRDFAEEEGDDAVIDPPEALHAIGEPHRQLRDQSTVPPRPSIPLGSSDLLVNAKNEPRVGHAIKREVQSADRIDLLCAFIRWHGVRVLRERGRKHRKRLSPKTTPCGGVCSRAVLTSDSSVILPRVINIPSRLVESYHS